MWPLAFGVGFIFTWQWRGKDAAMEELAVYAAFGVVAVIAVGLLLFLLQIPSQYRRIRSDLETERQLSVTNAGKKRAMQDWLVTMLSGSNLGIVGIAAFGSVVKDYDAADVDIVVVCPRDPLAKHRKRVGSLDNVFGQFHELFGKPVHVQWFYEDEQAKIRAFLNRANGHRTLFGTVG